MTIIKILLTIFHVIASFMLVIVILMQAAKGGGLSGTFGGTGVSAMFGPRSASGALTKFTQYLAAIFLILSFSLSMIAGGGTQVRSVTQQVLQSSPSAGLPPVESIQIGSPEAEEVPLETIPIETAPAQGE